jgi:hypothetical protein
VAGEDQPFAGEIDLGEEVVAGVKPKAMTGSARSVFGDLLYDGYPDDQVRVGQGKETQQVETGGIDMSAEHQAGRLEGDFVESVAAMVHAGEARGEGAVELEVQRPQQEGQLLGVRIEAEVALALFDDLELLAIIGLDGRCFTRAVGG